MMSGNVIIDSDSEDEIPPGWEERATVDGSVYYVNHSVKCTQWIHPRTGKKKVLPDDLPFGWEKIVKPDGKIQFHDVLKDTTTLIDPRLAFATEETPTIKDIRYQYDSFSNALEVLHGQDLSKYIAIVTGANSGIGYETARSLALHGCCVILACRSLIKANDAASKIKEERPHAKCVPMQLDLSSLNSVEEFATEFLSNYNTLNILILNAGVFGVPYSLTEDKYETTFQVCHLSHYYLTRLLEDVIMASSPARVIILSSESHRFSNLNVDTIDESTLSPPADKFWSLMAYNNAKLCNVLFAYELHHRWHRRGVQVFVVHPGNLVWTNLARYWWPYKLLFFIFRPFTKSLQQAASTSVFCATSPSLSQISGGYFNHCHPCKPSNISMNPTASEKLWILSETLVRNALRSSSTQL